MVETCPQEFIDFAETLADAARPVIRRHFRTRVAVDTKADKTPVTVADRDAEAAMRALIAERYPDHGTLGEEFGADRSDADYVWVLDPIDGTRAFITGRPLFGTLIALVRKNLPILGIIDQAVLDERWIGAQGQRTTLNGAPAHARPCGRMGSAILNTTSPDLFDDSELPAFRRLAGECATTMYGGDCYGYALLASGYLDLVVEAGLKPHDFCALAPVVSGAGGVVTDWSGHQMTMNSDGRILAAGDPALVETAVDLLSLAR